MDPVVALLMVYVKVWVPVVNCLLVSVEIRFAVILVPVKAVDEPRK